MNVVGVIPARMAASRFPGKPLAKILGMEMIGHCYHRTRLALGRQAAYVATCDKPIAEYVSNLGGNAILTGDHHNRATTRTAEALDKIEKETGRLIDIVVMVQGDEPLISPAAIKDTISHFSDPAVGIVNLMSRFKTFDAFKDKNNVKVVVNTNHDAIYFSREPIPSPWKGWESMPCYMQTGIIAFRRNALLQFNGMDETPLEKCESVDMNRVIETGGRIRMVLTESFTLGVDTPEDLKQAERKLRNDSTVADYITQ